MLFIKEILILTIIYYWLVLAVFGEQIKVKQCKKHRNLVNSEVHEVSITPCHSGRVCDLYKGTNASIAVKFTPFEVPPNSSSLACKIKSKLGWVSKIEMDFGDMSSNACDYMKCPLVANEETIFNATFFVPRKLPSGPYPLRLRVFEKSGNRAYFCQVFKVRLTDQPAEIVVN